jgi:hypothetical protein
LQAKDFVCHQTKTKQSELQAKDFVCHQTKTKQSELTAKRRMPKDANETKT